MAGSVAVAAFVAHAVFWSLLVWGLVSGELGVRRSAVFMLLWLAGLFGIPSLTQLQLFPSFVALLDLALVFMIFKGDVRIT